MGPKTLTEQRLLLFHDSSDQYAQLVYSNVFASLVNARAEFDTHDLAGFAYRPDLEKYSTILFCAESLDKITDQSVSRISKFVSDGGGLVVVYRGWNTAFADLFGVATGQEHPGFSCQEDEGLCFPSDIFPGFEGLSLNSHEISGHTSLNISPDDNAQVIATSYGGRPLAWLCHFGQGRVLYWNTAVLAEKRLRGLIVQSFACVQHISVLPIANVAIVQIDDFPAPSMEDGHNLSGDEGIKADAPSFFYDTWHGDLLSLAKTYNLTFTYLTIFNYNHNTQPPFSFEEWELPNIRLNGQLTSLQNHARNITLQGGEIGLHGYNHLPLTLSNWSKKEDMIEALNRAVERWQTDQLGPPPVTYVPPNNEFDQVGAQALTAAIPSLKIVSCLFTNGDYETGGDREFGPEPWNPRLFSIPRATSGHECTPGLKLNMLSLLSTMGVWTHFIHADDILDTPQNDAEAIVHRNPYNLPWRSQHKAKGGNRVGLYDQLVDWIVFVKTSFPWLRFVETKQALPILATYLDNEFKVEFETGSLSITSKSPGFFSAAHK